MPGQNGCQGSPTYHMSEVEDANDMLDAEKDESI